MIEMMQQMMQQMINRMDTLENQRITPPTPPTRTATLPKVQQEADQSKYPDPERFDGDRNKYPQFQYEAKAKLRHSYAHKNHAYQIDYIMGRTKDKAARAILPWVEKNVLAATIEDMWTFMDRQFKDPYQKTRALDKLRHLVQGKKLVRDYISEFNQLLQESEQAFEEDTLKSMLSEGLKIEVQRHMIMVLDSVSFDQFCNEAIKISDQLYRISIASRGQVPNTSRSVPDRHPSPPRQPTARRPASPERMDWQPTSTTANQSNVGKKRAKWVSGKEIQRRRDGGLCVRCGTDGHYVQSCPYQAARRPSPVRAARALPAPIAPLLEDDPVVELELESESEKE